MEGGPQHSQASFANTLQGLHLAPGTSTWCVPGVGQGECRLQAPQHAVPSGSGVYTHPHLMHTHTTTPPLLLRVRHRTGWELLSCPIAMSCHLLTAQSHGKPLGQQDQAEGNPAAPGAAPLPGHCRLRADRAGGEGSHPDTALYCKPTREQPSPTALLEPRLSHAHPAVSFLLPSGPALAPSRGSLGKLCTREEAEKMFLRHH